MTMDDSDVPVQASSPRESKTDAERAARFEREALPLLDPLYRGALALTGDRSEAEDLLQETMMNAYREFGIFAESPNLRTSLYRALTNAYISIWPDGHGQLAERPTDMTTDRQPPAAARSSTGLSLAQPECAPLQRFSEGGTCAGQLDWFDREIVRYVLLWAPYGEVWDEDVYPTFGMTVEELVDRFHRIIDTSVPLLGRVAKSDRELLDKARQLPRVFGQAR